MKTKTPTQVMDELAQAKLGADINLSAGIQVRLRKENEHRMMKKRLLSGAAAVALTLIVLISIPSVAQAMKRLLGYIPGLGVVEQNLPLRVLEEPAQAKDGDTVVSVKQAVIDQQHTIIFYQVENIPGVKDNPFANPREVCHAQPRLRLTDGTLWMGATSGADFWENGYSRRLDFSALPAAENEAALVFTCFEGAPLTPDAKVLEIPLRFIAAPPQMTVYPLMDLPTPTPAATEVSAETLAPEALSPASQISLTLNKYVQTGEGIALFGMLDTISTDYRIQYVDSEAVHLIDAAGAEIPLIEDPSLADPQTGNTDGRSLGLTYRSAGKYSPGAATLIIDNVWVGLKDQVDFTFDPGPNPQPGQTWVLNKALEVGGYPILVKDVSMDSSANGLLFNLELPAEVAELSLMDFEHPVLGGGGPGAYGFTYQEKFPAGVITVSLLNVLVNLAGPWQTTIDLPQ